ncbi:MAG: hypothetical protein H0V42_12115 [Nocardioidaceae bacterium]|nr:hypothetical protein [Nocardioidaceae bacterium]
MNILIRVIAFATAWALFSLTVLWLSEGRGDANIGVGLLAFGLLMLGAGVWGAFDGMHDSYARVAVTWVSVALLMGVVVPVTISLTEAGFSGRVLLSDVLTVGPFIAVLVAGAALIGGLVGMAVRSSPRRGGRSDSA